MLQKKIYLAGGCFWGMQSYYDQLQGVLQTSVGYANGTIPNPTYALVCQGQSGFAETLELTYDADIVPLSHLLDCYFEAIDPTSLNRQGNDFGTQYRSGIYYLDCEEEAVIQSALMKQQAKYTKPLVVECKQLQCFYSAEEEHQKYLKKHPNGYCHISFPIKQHKS